MVAEGRDRRETDRRAADALRRETRLKEHYIRELGPLLASAGVGGSVTVRHPVDRSRRWRVWPLVTWVAAGERRHAGPTDSGEIVVLLDGRTGLFGPRAGRSTDELAAPVDRLFLACRSAAEAHGLDVGARLGSDAS